MMVRTHATLPGVPEAVWPLLCSSAMDRHKPCLFRLGVPKPVECRLPGGKGGVGARRECVSEQGHVGQRILRWEPPRFLSFEMVETDLFFAKYVAAIEERFELSEMGAATFIVRATQVKLMPGRGPVRALLLYAGLKQVHRYVFRNWATLLRRTSPPRQATALSR